MNTKIDSAFIELRANNFRAVHNLPCCTACGWVAILRQPVLPDSRGTIFYTTDDVVRYMADGHLYLAWDGPAKEMVAIFRKHGLIVSWGGGENQRILIRCTEDIVENPGVTRICRESVMKLV